MSNTKHITDNLYYLSAGLMKAGRINEAGVIMQVILSFTENLRVRRVAAASGRPPIPANLKRKRK